MSSSSYNYDDFQEVGLIDISWDFIDSTGISYIILGLQTFSLYFIGRFLLESTGVIWLVKSCLTPGQEIWEIPYIIVSIVSLSFLAYITNSLLNKFEALLQKVHQDKMFYIEHIANLEKENEEMKQIFKRIAAFAELD